MQDSLIGYLLGALDDAEAKRMEAELERDETLRAQLRHAAASLQIMRTDPDDIEPPPGLAMATCCFVQQQSNNPGQTAPRPKVDERGMGSDSQWTLVDMVIAASVLLAGCMLAFPAINNSRYHAGIAGCQNNLRSIGQALIEYSSHHARGMFPEVPEFGKLAAAGMYAPTLLDAGFITQDHVFHCPAQTNFDLIVPIPRIDEIERADGSKLDTMHASMGGGYGYVLGTNENNTLVGVRNLGRNHYAIMSDSPERFDCQRQPLKRRLQHRNVLFEGGCVKSIANSTDCWRGDQLFVNDWGLVGAGVHHADSVIGASSTAPVIHLSASDVH